MKKVLFIPIVAVAFFTSCKKDRTCTCTTVGSSTSQVYTLKKISKSDAKNACLATKTSIAGSGYTTTNCVLK